MKNVILLICVILVSCNNTKATDETADAKTEIIDVEAELTAIEKTRAAYERALKEKNFDALRNLSFKDTKALSPNCGPWETFLNLRRNPRGEFSYDSLVMSPKETIVVSDSVAYDFGTSSTFYTNDNGEPIEISANYLALLKKDKSDGRWKLYREVANVRSLE